MKRIFIRMLLCCLLLVAATGAWASVCIDLLTPADNADYLDLTKAIRHNLQRLDQRLQITVRTVDGSTPVPSGRHCDLAIAVGDAVLPWAIAHHHRYQNTLAFYVTSTTYAALDPPAQASAVFRNQPLTRQLALLRLLLPQAHSAVLVVDEDGLPARFAARMNDTSFEFSVLDISREPNWPRALSQRMVDNDVLLAQDDAGIYNRDNARSLLLTTYRHGKVIIGPNHAFVAAGSLASAYTSSDQYLRQLIDTVAIFLHRGELPEPSYPTEFRVAINQQVARALDIRVPSEVDATRQLQLQLQLQEKQQEDKP